MDDDSHECPAPGCTVRVIRDRLACRDHWFALPKDIRQRVWREYQREPQSPEHLRAIADAIATMH